MRKPDIRDVREVVNDSYQVSSAFVIDGKAAGYVPARSYGPNQLAQFGRFKAAWLVFTGRADAITYPGQ